MCQEYLEVFERNLGELTAINVKLERKVELNARYKDAVSSDYMDSVLRITLAYSIPAVCFVGTTGQSKRGQPEHDLEQTE